MRNEDLIAALQKLDPELDVYVEGCDGCLGVSDSAGENRGDGPALCRLLWEHDPPPLLAVIMPEPDPHKDPKNFRPTLP